MKCKKCDLPRRMQHLVEMKVHYEKVIISGREHQKVSSTDYHCLNCGNKWSDL